MTGSLARERIRNILERWFLTEPLLFSIWSDHQVISAAVSTIRVGGGIIRYNPDFIDSLTRPELEAVMHCEAVRILLKHPYTRCLLPAHIAWQASNITLKEHLGPLPIALPSAFEVFGHHQHDRQFYEFYHQRLLESADSADEVPNQTSGETPHAQPNRATGAGGTDQAASASDHPPEGTKPDQPPTAVENPLEPIESEVETESDQHRLDSHLHSARTGLENTQDWQKDDLYSEKIDQRVTDAEMNRSWGSLAGTLKERVLANRQPQLDYRSVLRLFHQSVLSRKRRLTRMKCSRRYGFLYHGSRYDFTTHLLVAVDVSGSMSADDLSLGFSLVNRFFRYGIESIDVIAFDTRIQGEVMTLKHARRDVTVTGRGGTDFNAVIDYLDAHPMYDGVLIFTDGYAPCPHPPQRQRVPLLWVFLDQQNYQASVANLRPLGRAVYLKPTGSH